MRIRANGSWRASAAAALAAVALASARADDEKLTLDGVLDLLAKKTPVPAVIERIKASGLKLALQGEELDRLRKAGATEPLVAALAKPRVTKSAVVALAKGGTSEEELVKRIRESESRYELTIDQALALGHAGVPAAAIREMKQHPLKWVDATRGRVRLRAPGHWWVLPEQKAEDGTHLFAIDFRMEGTPFRAAQVLTVERSLGLDQETLAARAPEFFQSVVAKPLAGTKVTTELEPGYTVTKRDGLVWFAGHMKCAKGEEKGHGSFFVAIAPDAVVFGWFLAGQDDQGEERSLADAAIATIKLLPAKKDEPGHDK